MFFYKKGEGLYKIAIFSKNQAKVYKFRLRVVSAVGLKTWSDTSYDNFNMSYPNYNNQRPWQPTQPYFGGWGQVPPPMYRGGQPINNHPAYQNVFPPPMHILQQNNYYNSNISLPQPHYPPPEPFDIAYAQPWRNSYLPKPAPARPLAKLFAKPHQQHNIINLDESSPEAIVISDSEPEAEPQAPPAPPVVQVFIEPIPIIDL
jgi:hypothetical protein